FCLFFFFFQAEDGIRDDLVTGVQTCALPISGKRSSRSPWPGTSADTARAISCFSFPFKAVVGLSSRDFFSFHAPAREAGGTSLKIGRASCRERVQIEEVEGACKKKKRVGCHH